MSSNISDGYSAKDLARSPAVQIAVYLVGLTALLGLLAQAFPAVRQLYLPGASSVPDLGGFEDIATGSGQWPSLYTSVAETAILGVLALLGSLMFAIPIVRIYAVTMRQDGYDKSFVRLLVALPVVVSGVVRIVQNDLALAFALAGIVAAVRFRTTVKDLQDAFFAFAAIAIGLAAGTGNFVMAGATSAVITVVVYGMWRLNVGEVGPSLELPYGGVTLAEALVPGESHKAVVVGDDEGISKVGASDLDRLQESIDHLVGYVRADALRKKKKYNTLLIAHADHSKLKSTQQDFEKALSSHAKRFVHVDRIELGDAEVVALVYLARLKKSVDIGKMVRSFEDDVDVNAVELKPIGGLRKRLT